MHSIIALVALGLAAVAQAQQRFPVLPPMQQERQYPTNNEMYQQMPPRGPMPPPPPPPPRRGHGGPGGMMMGMDMGMGKKGMRCPSAIGKKVEQCLANGQNGPSVIYINTDPEIFNKTLHDMMEMKMDDEDEDGRMEQMKSIFKGLLEGSEGETIQRLIQVMMSCHLGMYSDMVLRNVSAENANVAFGYGNNWHFIEGTEPARANWTQVHERVMQRFENSTLMQLFKTMMSMEHDGPRHPPMAGPPSMMPPMMGPPSIMGPPSMMGPRGGRQPRFFGPPMVEDRRRFDDFEDEDDEDMMKMMMKKMKPHFQLNATNNLAYGMILQALGDPIGIIFFLQL